MRNPIKTFHLMCLIGAIAVILPQCNTTTFQSIEAEAFAALINTSDVAVLDVRTAKEHDMGHIPGTEYNIDVKSSDFISEAIATLSKDTPIALYCRSGNRSKTAADLLHKEGYKVYELSTGFMGWLETGYPAADTLVAMDNAYDKLKIYYPQYDSIDLVCGIASPEENHKAIFSCAAAFTAGYLDEFKHSNINGDHVSGGKHHNGSPYNRSCFVWYNGTWKFTDKNGAKEALRKAAENGGMGFRQIALILGGQKQNAVMNSSNIYRALCELNGKLCIIESADTTPLPEFINELANAGVTNALYLDMGSWNHCWYRKYEHYPATYLHSSKHNFYTNWLTFYIK